MASIWISMWKETTLLWLNQHWEIVWKNASRDEYIHLRISYYAILQRKGAFNVQRKLQSDLRINTAIRAAPLMIEKFHSRHIQSDYKIHQKKHWIKNVCLDCVWNKINTLFYQNEDEIEFYMGYKCCRSI